MQYSPCVRQTNLCVCIPEELCEFLKQSQTNRPDKTEPKHLHTTPKPKQTTMQTAALQLQRRACVRSPRTRQLVRFQPLTLPTRNQNQKELQQEHELPESRGSGKAKPVQTASLQGTCAPPAPTGTSHRVFWPILPGVVWVFGGFLRFLRFLEVHVAMGGDMDQRVRHKESTEVLLAKRNTDSQTG